MYALYLLACWADVADEDTPRPPRDDGGSDSADSADADTDADADSDGDADADSDADGDTDADADSDAEPEVCERWNADRADLSEASWSGSTGSCDAGDMNAAGRARALRVLNLYRALADLPEVETDAGWDDDAQDCALMMHANNSLSPRRPMERAISVSTPKASKMGSFPL